MKYKYKKGLIHVAAIKRTPCAGRRCNPQGPPPTRAAQSERRRRLHISLHRTHPQCGRDPESRRGRDLCRTPHPAVEYRGPPTAHRFPAASADQAARGPAHATVHPERFGGSAQLYGDPPSRDRSCRRGRCGHRGRHRTPARELRYPRGREAPGRRGEPGTPGRGDPSGAGRGTRIHLLSLTDDLTSLPNRRAFLRRLQDEVSRVQRYGNPLSLALIDLDGFKSVIDKLGYAAGDEVLRVVANEILSIFRHHDLVARYGGEEFAVLLPNTHVEGALRALRKVQKRAQESSVQYQGSTIPLPTFSAGRTLYRPGESPEAFIQRADHTLYRAKRLGRNRIESDQLDPTTAGVPSSMI